MLIEEHVASTFASLLFCSCNVLACHVIFTTKQIFIYVYKFHMFLYTSHKKTHSIHFRSRK